MGKGYVLTKVEADEEKRLLPRHL